MAQETPQETTAQLTTAWRTLNTMLEVVAAHDYSQSRPSVISTPVGPADVYYVEIDGDCFVEVGLEVSERWSVLTDDDTWGALHGLLYRVDGADPDTWGPDDEDEHDA